MNPQLKHVAHLIKTNQRDEAHQLLSRYVVDKPRDSWAWYFLSFTESEAHEKIDAAQQAVALSPDTPKFQARLAQLQTATPLPQSRKRVTAGLVAVAFVTLIAVVGAVALSQSVSPSSRQLPTTIALADSTTVSPATQAVMATDVAQEASAIPVESSAMPEEQVVETDLPATATRLSITTPVIEATKNEAVSSVANPTSQAPRESAAIGIAATSAPLTTESASPSTGNATDAPVTPDAEATLAPTTAGAQNTPVASATAVPPVQPTAPVVVVVESGAPLNTALNVGMGEMRVISATRPAESYIRELGGVMPAAPANQSWVLVEVLIICQSNPCTATPSNVKVVGASGVAYNASSQLTMSPILGSSVANGQIWGYVGFVVPNSESRLNLVFSRNNQNYAFSLQ